MKIPRRVGQAETRPPLQHSSRKIASSRPDQLGEVELSAVDAFPHPLHAFTRPPTLRDLRPSHSTRTKRKAIAKIQQYVLIRWRSRIPWMEFSEPTGAGGTLSIKGAI